MALLKLLKRILGVFTALLAVTYFAMSREQEYSRLFIIFGGIMSIFTILLFYPTKKERAKNAVRTNKYPKERVYRKAKMKKFVLIAFLIVWAVYCISGILNNSSRYQIVDWIIVIAFFATPYIMTLLALKKLYKLPKAANETIEKSSVNDTAISKQTDADTIKKVSTNNTAIDEQAYIKTDNTIYKANGEKITDEEIPYLIQITREEAIAKWETPDIIRCIQESYQLMYNTDNPETLCNRYKFVSPKVKKLTHFYNQGWYTDADKFNQYTEMFSDENYLKLILRCYQKYIVKAKRELKTSNGISKRIARFWGTIQVNVSPEMYLQLKKQAMLLF